MRKRICAAAAAGFAARGFHQTTIPDVARRAKASVGALQHHFPSKTALVVATAEYLLNRSIAWFRRAKLELPSAAGSEAFSELIARSWQQQFKSLEYSALLEILVAARTDRKILNAIAPSLESWRTEIDSELRMLKTAPDEVERLTLMLTISRCLMTGLLVHDGLLGDDAGMDRVIEDWARQISRSFDPKPQGVSSTPKLGKRSPRFT